MRVLQSSGLKHGVVLGKIPSQRPPGESSFVEGLNFSRSLE